MAFGPIMTIQGLPYVSLRPIDHEDIGEFVRDGAMQSGRVKQFLDSQFAQVFRDEEEWYEKVRTDHTQLVWGIYAEENLIGTTGFEGIGDQHFHPYFKGAISGGMIFRPDHWDLGIMGTCHKARTWYGLTQAIGLQRIISGVYA
ncbi:MAG: GNAT family N-acetyltransferase, partial [Microcoleus sp.]